MQIQSKIPAFEEVSHILIQVHTQTTPSELHGVLSGLVCIGSRLNGKFWLDSLLQRFKSFGDFAKENQGLILSLYDGICRQLNGMEDEYFEIMLPNENSSLTKRAEALSQWCQGFLYGLNVVDNLIDTTTPDDVHEALRCISELAKLDFTDIQVGEMDATAYFNVLEYVESSVEMIYLEFNQQAYSLH